MTKQAIAYGSVYLDAAKEKQDNSSWKTIGGFLKRFGYKEAWATWWSEAKPKDRQAILDLPHFNTEIFKKITGINIEKQDCTPQEIEINGKKYRLIR